MVTTQSTLDVQANQSVTRRHLPNWARRNQIASRPSVRTEVVLDLHLNGSRTPGQFDIAWTVHASGRITPDEFVVDLRIDSVERAMASYDSTGWWLQPQDAAEADDCLAYLQSQLRTRDDWQQAIHDAVESKFVNG